MDSSANMDSVSKRKALSESGDSEAVDSNPPKKLKVDHPGTETGAENADLEVESPANDMDEDLNEAKLKKQTACQMEEKKGDVEFKVVRNDGKDENMVILTALKNIFQKQLPNMPKEYIARLVYDVNHCGLAVMKPSVARVLGGVSIRPFPHKKFAEIVFLAISSTEQVKGYGSRLMAHLKEFVKQEYGITNFLTYADNYAVGYFKKQGFSTDITIDIGEWTAYIKDYEGGTLMHCAFVEKINYLDYYLTLNLQRRFVLSKISKTANSHIIFDGLPRSQTKLQPNEVPGLLEAGWTPDMDKFAEKRHKKPKQGLAKVLADIVEALESSSHAWPFATPVTGVEGYYEVIQDPMDLQTLRQNIDADCYTKLEDFEKDAKKIFVNCRRFNEDGSRYVRCADELEKELQKLLQLAQSGEKAIKT